MPLSGAQKLQLAGAFRQWCRQNGVGRDDESRTLFLLLLQGRPAQITQMRTWVSTTRATRVEEQGEFDASVPVTQAAQAQEITDLDGVDTVLQSGSL